MKLTCQTFGSPPMQAAEHKQHKAHKQRCAGHCDHDDGHPGQPRAPVLATATLAVCGGRRLVCGPHVSFG